ncbi:MAG TPA: hypothetical protein VMR86_20775 [Myxococcota bacterium]|nr:hypothetical protein [Myxococcota bacterium]
MADSIKLKQALSLKHQANLGEDVEEIELSAGDELAVLQEWDTAYLAKTSDGKLFNVKKELAEPA